MFTQSLFKNLTDYAAPSAKQDALEMLYALRGFYGHSIEINFVIHSVIDAVNGTKPLNGDAIRQAAILDALSKTRKTYLVGKLLEMGATYSRGDIDDILPVNKQAAQLLEKNHRMKAKL